MYSAKILADSLSPDNVRLTTFEVTLPRIVLAEFNTHRVFSRNSASSRAIPVAKNIDMVKWDPFIPDVFFANERGMQAYAELTDTEAVYARDVWMEAASGAIRVAEELEKTGVHKALANRILEPFKWHTIIVTATEWSNFFALRCDENAQAEIRLPAQMMRDLYAKHEPSDLDDGEWHLPLVDTAWRGSELYRTGLGRAIGPNWDYWKKVSVGRCARVSYLTHDGVRDPDKDIELHDRLMTNGHLSPFEHVARPWSADEWETCRELQIEISKTLQLSHERRVQLCRQAEFDANFRGWHQYRGDIPNEHDFSLVNP